MAYATVEDLDTYLGDEDPPANAATLLDRASVYIDDLLIGAFYAVDDNGMPTDPDVIAALRDATCAQVQFWSETGNTTGTETGDGQWRSVSIGNVSLSRVSGGSGGGSGQAGSASVFSPDAIRILRLAGLLPIAPWVYG